MLGLHNGPLLGGTSVKEDWLLLLKWVITVLVFEYSVPVSRLASACSDR
jgi:hypothetical protein